MSAQSIVTKTISSLLNESDCTIMKMSNDLYLKRKYELGNPCSKSRILEEVTLNRIFKSQDCGIKKLITNEFIDGGVFVFEK